MAGNTLHVYHSDGAWVVKKEGRRAVTFGTQREAMAAAVRGVKGSAAGQIVLHGKDGRIVDHRTYGMPKIQEPPQKGPRRSSRIAKAVSKVVMERLKSDPGPPRVHTPATQ